MKILQNNKKFINNQQVFFIIYLNLVFIFKKCKNIFIRIKLNKKYLQKFNFITNLHIILYNNYIRYIKIIIFLNKQYGKNKFTLDLYYFWVSLYVKFFVAYCILCIFDDFWVFNL